MDKPDASTGGTFMLGGDLTVNRPGFGAMGIPGGGIWGEAADVEGAKKVLRQTHPLHTWKKM